MHHPATHEFEVIVIGGGHAGVEAAWAAANLGAPTALVTIDPAKIGAMSCNPAIGGLAKGQIVREIDALGGLMALAADATGLQYRILNASKGPAVRGPRCQSDKYLYARRVQQLIASRPQITVLGGTVDDIIIEDGCVRGVIVAPTRKPPVDHKAIGCDDQRILGPSAYDDALQYEAARITQPTTLLASAVVLTTGTFMRGLMHTGQTRVQGGRMGEAPAVGISAALQRLGLSLGRLKTGTPPRLDAKSINFDKTQPQPGDPHPTPFSDLTATGHPHAPDRFPAVEQRPCHITHTCEAIHQHIRDNLDRAPLFNGQIEQGSVGPRYCPSIEDKVVRFKDKQSHHVFLEPESLSTSEIYCNGIPTSLPADVQDFMVRNLPGCENAHILRYGYAVEYDMVWPHQIDATGMTKAVRGLFLAGQINGTSGYEEAAGQGLIAGLNAVRLARGRDLVRLRRDQAYIGVLMDDLVTKTPREPYRMFTSRAEYRLLLRADNADQRLTPLAREWGLASDARSTLYQQRQAARDALRHWLAARKRDGRPLVDWLRRPDVDAHWVAQRLREANGDGLRIVDHHDAPDHRRRDAQPDQPQLNLALIEQVRADISYEGYIARQRADMDRLARQESTPIPPAIDYQRVHGLRNEARQTLERFRPATMGQAARLAGVTPADLMLLTVAMGR